jgi:cytidylate kinase
MGNKVITISREFGSGGRTIGKMVADKLGIPCYDQEIIQKIAQESGYCENFVADRSEHASISNWFVNAFGGKDYYGNSIQDKLWVAQLKAIVEVANKGDCVIVGRCADFILKETADCIRVFVHAELQDKCKRIVEQYGESNEIPERRLRDKDKRRAAYYQLYTDQKWGDLKNYDIALNTSTLSFDQCTEIIVNLYNNK